MAAISVEILSNVGFAFADQIRREKPKALFDDNTRKFLVLEEKETKKVLIVVGPTRTHPHEMLWLAFENCRFLEELKKKREEGTTRYHPRGGGEIRSISEWLIQLTGKSVDFGAFSTQNNVEELREALVEFLKRECVHVYDERGLEIESKKIPRHN